jgi:hypothetical protein
MKSTNSISESRIASKGKGFNNNTRITINKYRLYFNYSGENSNARRKSLVNNYVSASKHEE